MVQQQSICLLMWLPIQSRSIKRSVAMNFDTKKTVPTVFFRLSCYTKDKMWKNVLRKTYFINLPLIFFLFQMFSLLTLSAISFSLYKVVTFVETHNETDTEHTPEEYSKVASSLYILHSYMMIVYLYYIIISILLVIGVHMVNNILYFLVLNFTRRRQRKSNA